MDLNAIRARVRKLSGVEMESLLTPSELDQIINEAYTHVCSLAPWTFLKAEAETTVAIGVRIVPLPDPVKLPLSVAMLSPSANRGLLRQRRSEAFDRYPEWEAEPTDGIPWAYAIRTDTDLEVFPTPDSEVTLRVRGWIDVAELVNDTDTPIFAEQYHPVVSLDAAQRVLYEEGDDSGRSSRYREEALTYLLRMGRRYLLDDQEEAARAYAAAGGSDAQVPEADAETAGR